MLWPAWIWIKALCIWKLMCVCTRNHRDKAGKQQCPLRRAHPHRGLVTRWAAGSPLSLASWGRLSTGNSESMVFPAKRRWFPSPHLPTPTYPCFSDKQGLIQNRELPLGINSHAIILLWWAFAPNLKQWLRISGNVSESPWAWETGQTSARSHIETDAVNVNGSQWGQNNHTSHLWWCGLHHIKVPWDGQTMINQTFYHPEHSF